MSDYAQLVFYGPKDALATGNPLKLIRGTEIDAELDAISDAIATKADLSGDSILFGDGTAGAPSMSFASDTDTGGYRVGADQYGFTVGGTRATYYRNLAGAVQQLSASGTAALPFYSFNADDDSGLYWVGSGDVRMSLNGLDRVRFHASASPLQITAPDATGDLYISYYESNAFTTRKGYVGFGNTGSDEFDVMNEENSSVRIGTNSINRLFIGTSDITSSLVLLGPSGSVSAPTYSFSGDANSGVYSAGADDVGITAGGVLVAQFRNVAGAVKLLIADGTSSNPSLAFDGDEDTGVQRLGSGIYVFISNGTEIGGIDTIANGGMYRRESLGNRFPVGYLEVPQNSQAGNYTLVAADSGKHVLHPSGGGAGDTFTIPANGSVAYPVGTALTFANRDSNDVSIAITTDTLILGGTTTTGTRTLGQNGMATAMKVESTTWIIQGTALT